MTTVTTHTVEKTTVLPPGAFKPPPFKVTDAIQTNFKTRFLTMQDL